MVKPRVLVVDDDPPTTTLLSDILERAGYDVVAVNDPRLALQIGGPRFVLAAIDVVMPGMSGDELARRLRVLYPDLKILFITGYPEALFQAQPQLWEGQAFLEKPITDAGVTEAVALLLTGRMPARSGAAPIGVARADGDGEPII